MKVGDLVTLSAYGCGLTELRRWNPHFLRVRKERDPVGLVIKMEEHRFVLGTQKFYVRWIGDHGPEGRTRWRGDKHFLRKDLKLVK